MLPIREIHSPTGVHPIAAPMPATFSLKDTVAIPLTTPPSAPAGMSLMTQVAGVLKTTAKDFNVAALVRMARLTALQDADGVLSVSLDLGSCPPPLRSEIKAKYLTGRLKEKRLTSSAVPLGTEI